MLLATWLQLHILLSAAPVLAGWTPALHSVPFAPGQAVYGVLAAHDPASVHSPTIPAAAAAFFPHPAAVLARQANSPARIVPALATRRQSLLVSPLGPRAP